MNGRTGRGHLETDEGGHRGKSAGLQVLAAVALVAVALGAGPQTAMAYGTPVACSSRSEAPVFAPWGDSATYFLVPNGNFENRSANWLLTGGAAVVDGNETYNVGGPFDGHSLRIPPNATAESRTICVSVGEDTIRLFVNNQHVSGAILHVDAIAQNPSNGATAWTAFDVNGDVPSAGWAPTMQFKIPRQFAGSGTEALTLRFTTRGTAATWNIDDVYVDPFKSW